MNYKNLCIIQARTGSTRLPEKVLLKVNGIPLLEYEIERVKQAKQLDKIVVATTDHENDKKIKELCDRLEIDCFRGSENDVLDRYYQCSLKYPEYENIVRITGDCPLIDPAVIDEAASLFEMEAYDYVSNVIEETFPDGMDVEVFNRHALNEAASKANLASEREHVTLYIRNQKKFRQKNLSCRRNLGHFRLTVDNPEDLAVVEFLIKNSKLTDGYPHYISLLEKNPAIMLKNSHLSRNEGLQKSLREDGISTR